MYEYKPLTERDSKFLGRFDPKSLEAVLNGYSADGWRVVSGFLAIGAATSREWLSRGGSGTRTW